MTALICVLALVLSGCAFQLGPDDRSWVRWSFWEGFNVQATVSPPGACIGCLELGGDGETEEEAEPTEPEPTLPDLTEP